MYRKRKIAMTIIPSRNSIFCKTEVVLDLHIHSIPPKLHTLGIRPTTTSNYQ